MRQTTEQLIVGLPRTKTSSIECAAAGEYKTARFTHVSYAKHSSLDSTDVGLGFRDSCSSGSETANSSLQMHREATSRLSESKMERASKVYAGRDPEPLWREGNLNRPGCGCDQHQHQHQYWHRRHRAGNETRGLRITQALGSVISRARRHLPRLNVTLGDAWYGIVHYRIIPRDAEEAQYMRQHGALAARMWKEARAEAEEAGKARKRKGRGARRRRKGKNTTRPVISAPTPSFMPETLPFSVVDAVAAASRVHDNTAEAQPELGPEEPDSERPPERDPVLESAPEQPVPRQAPQPARPLLVIDRALLGRRWEALGSHPVIPPRRSSRRRRLLLAGQRPAQRAPSLAAISEGGSSSNDEERRPCPKELDAGTDGEAEAYTLTGDPRRRGRVFTEGLWWWSSDVQEDDDLPAAGSPSSSLEVQFHGLCIAEDGQDVLKCDPCSTDTAQFRRYESSQPGEIRPGVDAREVGSVPESGPRTPEPETPDIPPTPIIITPGSVDTESGLLHFGQLLPGSIESLLDLHKTETRERLDGSWKPLTPTRNDGDGQSCSVLAYEPSSPLVDLYDS